MKRDPRLRRLSSDHHSALVLARRLSQLTGQWTENEGESLHRRFEQELEPHFRTEEELLLPALRAVGRSDLANRITDDHTALRAMVAAARAGDGRAARSFGERLSEHVRFEERELFPACEALLPGAVLDEVGRRAAGEA